MSNTSHPPNLVESTPQCRVNDGQERNGIMSIKSVYLVARSPKIRYMPSSKSHGQKRDGMLGKHRQALNPHAITISLTPSIYTQQATFEGWLNFGITRSHVTELFSEGIQRSKHQYSRICKSDPCQKITITLKTLKEKHSSVQESHQMLYCSKQASNLMQASQYANACTHTVTKSVNTKVSYEQPGLEFA